MTETAYFTGQCLLAMPAIGDPRFERAMVMMCVHDEQGALGLDFGRLVDGLGTNAVFGQLDLNPPGGPERPVFRGGPVSVERGFVVHSLDYRSEETIEVADRWGFTANIDVLTAISRGKGPKRWNLALGYSGWGAGQLEEEMTRPGWLVAKANDELLFDTPPDSIWDTSYRMAGIDPALLSGAFGSS